ncbi:hypothetical protein [Planctomicrobium piriforme]|uniref:Uncharacterized protein n=1 Tax=Planctomicrobium piriforme TaxID=1576369 RepID=A0A1I3EKC5_9PLAN|nr:hypothetical protein [Planctomicrobium piriforme]SFH99429.1 hypothetical protein SAMN05421753_104262 [Planctomicrobium piriforme]
MIVSSRVLQFLKIGLFVFGFLSAILDDLISGELAHRLVDILLNYPVIFLPLLSGAPAISAALVMLGIGWHRPKFRSFITIDLPGNATPMDVLQLFTAHQTGCALGHLAAWIAVRDWSFLLLSAICLYGTLCFLAGIWVLSRYGNVEEKPED